LIRHRQGNTILLVGQEIHPGSPGNFNQPVNLTQTLLILLIVLVFSGFYGSKVIDLATPSVNKLIFFVYHTSEQIVGHYKYVCETATKQNNPQTDREYQRCMEAGKKSGQPYFCVGQGGQISQKEYLFPVTLTQARYFGFVVASKESPPSGTPESTPDANPYISKCRFLGRTQ
jgi:hypothetical protein